jgi:hypothetical protein
MKMMLSIPNTTSKNVSVNKASQVSAWVNISMPSISGILFGAKNRITNGILQEGVTGY